MFDELRARSRELWDRLRALETRFWGSLVDNPSKSRALVAAIVIFLALGFCTDARSSELWVEAGATVTRAQAPVLGFVIEWPGAGPTDTDYQVGLHLIGSADGMRNQSALSFLLVDGIGRFDVGLGVCLLHHIDEISGSRGNFGLHLAYRFRGNRYAARARHCSNSGQTSPNKGRDLAVIGRRF